MPSVGRHLLVGLFLCACDATAPNVVATQQLGLVDIQARSGAVFWATTNAILTALSAGSVVTLASGLNGTATPIAIWVDDTDVYWLEDAALFAVPVAGGTPRMVASTDGLGLGLALTGDADNLYVLADLTLWKVPKIGGSPTTLVTFSNGIVPAGIAIDDTNVYWTNAGNISFSTTLNNGTVMSVSKNGGQPMTIATNQAYPGGIVSDGANVFWVDAGDNGYVPCAQSCVDGALMTSPVGTASPSVLVSDPSLTRVVSTRLEMHGGFIYWQGGSNGAMTTGGLLRVVPSGGSVETVIPGVDALFAVDDGDVYFGYGSANDSDIHKVPLP